MLHYSGTAVSDWTYASTFFSDTGQIFTSTGTCIYSVTNRCTLVWLEETYLSSGMAGMLVVNHYGAIMSYSTLPRLIFN